MNSYIFAAVVLLYGMGNILWLQICKWALPMVGATRNSASHLQICGYFGYGLYCWCGHDCEMGCCSSIENGRSQIAEQKGAIKWRTLKL